MASRCPQDASPCFVSARLDSGQPCNLRMAPQPDLAAALEERHIGGPDMVLIPAMVERVTCRCAGRGHIGPLV